MKHLGNLTIALLIALTSLVAVSWTQAPPASADGCYTWSRTLNQGTSGADVRTLQVRMAGWVPSGQQMSVDGAYGAQTYNAVRRFQAAYDLPVDGVAGPQTFNKIYELQDDDCTPIHFTLAEASPNCGRGFTGNATIRANLIRMLWQAEALRHQMGDRPLVVTSGYRDSVCNESVGGSSTSLHHSGLALDLVPYRGAVGTALCPLGQAARSAGGFELLGPGFPKHNDHIHLGVRSSKNWSAPTCGI